MTKIINLTPHAITIGDRVIDPSGDIARVATTTEVVGSFDGIDLTVTSTGDVVGLPDPVADTLYVVSAMVRLAVPDRVDVASPGKLLRDDKGQVIGCASLDINKKGGSK